MIKAPGKNEFQEIVGIISKSISLCITADESDIDEIIDDCVSSSRLWIQGDIDGVHLVYLVDGKVVGLILVKDFWNMTCLFVLPDFHNRGIATALVDEAMMVCRQRSPKSCIRLNSSSFASGFYQKYGFKTDGEPKDRPGGCIPYVYSF